jgi:hypothetical protein
LRNLNARDRLSCTVKARELYTEYPLDATCSRMYAHLKARSK